MQFPALLPKELRPYNTVTSEEALFTLLLEKPAALLLFFETACDDETWSGLHADLVCKMINWLTTQAFADKLPAEFCRRAVKAIHKHSSLLEPMIPKNITINFKDGHIEVNSLLLGTVSDFFKEFLLRQCRGKRKMDFSLEHVSKDEFMPVEGYISTGQVAALWKMGKVDLLALMDRAASWGITGIVQASEQMLRKYLTAENVIEMLVLAQQKGWTILKQECIYYINSLSWGFYLSAPTIERLAVEFFNFADNTLEHFKDISQLVTEIICKGAFADHPAFGRVMQQCPNLKLLDLSVMPIFSAYFYEIPASVQALNLSHCPWLSAAILKSFAAIAPQVNELHLASNNQLDFGAWGGLLNFKQLIKLDIAHCTQLKNEDFKIILKACSGLTELVIDNCHRLDDMVFFELARSLPRLTALNLAHCNLSDAALVEIGARCQGLLSLNLSHCHRLTEKGVFALLKQTATLQEINLAHCDFTATIVPSIKELKPRLKIISKEK